MSNSRVAARESPVAVPGMEYRKLGADEPLPATALCAITFGTRPCVPGAPVHQGLRIHVNLPTLVGTGLTELWHTDGNAEAGRDGLIHFARGAGYLAGSVAIDERAVGGLAAAASEAYDTICRFTARSGYRYLLRMYNYFSDINAGSGDAERYKLFCSGRAAGFRASQDPSWPAATAIGRQDDSPVLQVYWLAGNEPGRAIENPRQMSAFHYPRQYGRAPPNFSRAMQIAAGLLISGTASVLGHASHHRDDLVGQLDEVLRNLASVRQVAGGTALPQTGRGTLLKIYLRDAAMAGFVATYLRTHLPPQAQFLVLGADICRRELLVEIDAAHLG